MKQCYGYTRVSTAKQGEGVSLEAQKAAIENFADRNEITISKWFEEKETAAKSGRPIFNSMVSALKQRKAAGVVIHKIDRSARNFADWAKIGDLADAGIDIHFATESLDFRSRGGRLTADIQAVIAADYIRNLREETIKGMEGRLGQGLYPFRAPIGYVDNGGGKAKTIDPVRGPLVRKLFQLYATGNYSLWSMRKESKNIGLLNHSGKPLAKTGIEKILRNPFYVGIIKLRKSGKVYSGIHEPLVSSTLFDQVTAVRTGRDNKKETKHNHVYRGLFRCGYCAGAMIPELQKGRVYYRCHKKNCDTKTVREDQIESAMAKNLKRYTLNDAQATKLRDSFKQWLDYSDDKAKIQNAKFELTKLDARLSRLEDKLLDGVFDDETYERKKAVILIEQANWKKTVKERDNKAAKIDRLEKLLELFKNLYLTYVSAAKEQKREMVKFATSNRQAFAKNIVLEPSKWMSVFETGINLSYGDPTGNRTPISWMRTMCPSR